MYCTYVIFFTDEGVTKTFTCARSLTGQYVFLQLVGVEGSLSLCEVEVFTTDGKLDFFQTIESQTFIIITIIKWVHMEKCQLFIC